MGGLGVRAGWSARAAGRVAGGGGEATPPALRAEESHLREIEQVAAGQLRLTLSSPYSRGICDLEYRRALRTSPARDDRSDAVSGSTTRASTRLGGAAGCWRRRFSMVSCPAVFAVASTRYNV